MSRRIVMVGPDLSVQGGMASVERVILERPPDGWSLEHVPSFVDGAVYARLAAFLRGYRAAQRALPGAAGQHVHLSQRADVLRAIAFTRAAARRGVPTLLHAHASEFRVWFDRLPAATQRLLAAGLRRASLLAVLSESWKRYYVQALGFAETDVTVLPNPVAVPNVPAHGSDDGRVRVAFLGRIGMRKGAFDLVEAVRILSPETRARLHVTLAGDGEVARARRVAEEAGLTGVVDVRSWLGPEARDALLRRSDIFALPSHNEGLPMSLLEAMAFGLAPITTPVGGIPELVDDGIEALLVPAGEPRALAGALQRLVDDAGLRRTLAGRARERVLALSADHYAERLHTLYSRLERRARKP